MSSSPMRPTWSRPPRSAVQAIFRNSGQVCVAGSRLLVEASVHDAFAERVAALAGAMRVGNPLLLETEAGAVNSEAQLGKDLDHARRAEAEGARLLTGGNRVLEETGGFYMAPTVFGMCGPGWHWRARRCSARCWG
jgi:4-(gamma-glutamylamino)butanal dehydrogenase